MLSIPFLSIDDHPELQRTRSVNAIHLDDCTGADFECIDTYGSIACCIGEIFVGGLTRIESRVCVCRMMN